MMLTDKDFLAEMRRRYDRAVDADHDNRLEALDDLEFIAGEQWPAAVKAERLAANRPCLTINRLPQFIEQVVGDMRINKPAIKVLPRDDRADPELAELLTGLIRQIEYASDASEAYVRGAENAVQCGIGAWRVTTEYSADDGFDQDVRIRAIYSPFAVVWDPAARRLTREDAEWCFVVQEIERADFEGRYPDAQVSGWDGDDTTSSVRTWANRDTVRVVEYWHKEPVTRTLLLTRDGAAHDVTATPEAIEQAKAAGVYAGDRKVQGHKVVMHLCSGVEVLSGPHDWPGRYIPIVAVTGREVWVGETVIRHGLIRYAKDPQRTYNFFRSAAVEVAGLQPKAPFVGTVEQFAGLERYWSQANVAPLSYLPYKSDPRAPGPPQRQPPPQPDVAAIQEAAQSSDDLKATTGIYDAGLGARSNETSGKAILARQREGDVGTYLYHDHLSAAICHTGRILVDLIPRVYDGRRVVRVLGDDEAAEFYEINVILPDGSVKNDLSVGEYDVVVQTGPSYSTRRQEAAESLMQFAQAVPQAAAVVGDLIAKYQDWPGAEEIGKRLRKMAVAAGVAEPAEDDPPPQPPPPDPLAEQAQALSLAEAAAKVAKTRADAEYAMARARGATVEAGKTQAEAGGQEIENTQAALDLVMRTGAMQRMVQQLVEQALSQMLAPSPQPPQPGGFFVGAQPGEYPYDR